MSDERAMTLSEQIKMQAENQRLREALRGFLEIVNDSEGVIGWHLNGDILRWAQVSQVLDAETALASTEVDAGIPVKEEDTDG